MKLNQKFILFTPILLSLAVLLGVFIGRNINPSSNNSKNSKNSIVNEKLDKILTLINQEYVDTINTDKLTDDAIVSLLEQLDPHSSYIPPVDLSSVNEDMSGNFDGIGVEFNILHDTIVVVAAISGGPSEALGIRSGDRIVKIENKNVAGIKITNDEVIKSLRGKKGTKVNVSIKRKGINELIPYTITRDKIPLYSMDAAYMIDDKIGYIKLNRFAEKTFDEYKDAFDKLKKLGMQKMILDLRGNPGGYLNVAIELADEFLKNNEMIVYTQGRARKKDVYEATTAGEFENQPLAILIDEGSASASEIISGSLQDNDRAVIIGRRSFGKGLVQEQFEFPDGSAMRLTVARYYTASGRSIQRPYDKGSEEYYSEIYKEMQNDNSTKNSTPRDTSHKYKTKSGRIVYGGGGITPDIFVAVDTSGYTRYYAESVSKGLVYDFCFNYADLHRKSITATYKTYKEFYNDKNIAVSILSEYVKFAEQNGLKKNDFEITKSNKWLTNRLQSLIARNIWRNEAYYYIINMDDVDVTAAVKYLRSK